jgi:TolB-like protein/DNA-binding winged helix-turn-helix (wHTH) protein/Tfp pilus assembly protein PilF
VIFRFEDCELDSGRYELRRKGEPVALEPKTLDVLLHLAEQRNRLVSKQELLDAVWPGVTVTESTLTRAVSLARAAIGDSAQEPRVIETVAGRGYRWKAPVEVVEPAPPASPRPEPAPPRAPRRALFAGVALAIALAGALVASWPRPAGWLLALSGSARPPREPALPAGPSVVVLPFRDLSPDRGHAFLAEGLTEDLTSSLGRFPALFVIARSSAATYQAADVPIETVGRELGVRYAVQGSVRAAGDGLVVTSQLVDAQTGVQVWADRIETRLDDALAVQGRLAEDIVGALGTRIESAELARLRRAPTEDLDAYELYVRARADFYAFTREGHARARALIEQALALDPDYPHAVALQAALELAPFMLGWDVDPGRLARARALAARAVALDPSSAIPHTTLALTNMSEGRLDEAVADARTAVALGPNSDVCLGVQAAVLSESGSYLEALRSLDRALRLNPRHPELYWLMAGFLHAQAGRRAQGLELIERVRVANPDMIPPRLVLAYQYQGDGEQARVEALGAEIQRINPGLTAESALTIFPYARRDPARRARALAAFRAAGLR